MFCGFIGTPPMNFINGQVGEDGIFECGNQKFGVVRLAVPEKQLALLKEKSGRKPGTLSTL